MAPKANTAAKSLKKGTKFHAAMLKRPAGASNGSAGGRKITAHQCRKMVAALEGAEELPNKVRDMLAGLLGQSLSASQHPNHEATMAAVGEALSDIEARLSADFQEAKAVRDKDADKSAREESVQHTEAYVSEQKQNIGQLKLAIKASEQAVRAAQEALQSAKAAQKSTQTEHGKLEGKMMQLQAAEQVMYQPLKDASASGQAGQKKVKILRKVGKDFGFHDVLMQVLPAVLKKRPDRRRTFDGITMHQLEKEFSKHNATLQGDLKKGEASVEETSAAFQAARSLYFQSTTQLASHTRALAEAEENLSTGKSAVLEARRQVRAFDSDMRKSVKDLENRAARLRSFQRGPMAAFQELANRAPMEVEAHAALTLASDRDIDSVEEHGLNISNPASAGGISGNEEALTQTHLAYREEARTQTQPASWPWA